MPQLQSAMDSGEAPELSKIVPMSAGHEEPKEDVKEKEEKSSDVNNESPEPQSKSASPQPKSKSATPEPDDLKHSLGGVADIGIEYLARSLQVRSAISCRSRAQKRSSGDGESKSVKRSLKRR